MTIAGRAEAAGEPPVSPVGRTSPQPRSHGACLRFALRGHNMGGAGQDPERQKVSVSGCSCVKERKLMGNFASEKIFEKILLRKEDFCIFRCIL